MAITNLIQPDKLAVPVEISGQIDNVVAGVTGVDLTCTHDGDRHHLGYEQLASLNCYRDVAQAYPVAQRIIQLYANPHEAGDYIDWRIQNATLQLDINKLGAGFITMAGISVGLPCGHSIQVNVGESLAIPKEPDKVALLLKLGITSERSFRYLKVLYAGVDTAVPSSYGKKKADELLEYIRTIENERAAIQQKGEQFLDKLSQMHLSYGRFQQEVASTVKLWMKEDERALQQLEKAELDRLDELLLRVGLRA